MNQSALSHNYSIGDVKKLLQILYPNFDFRTLSGLVHITSVQESSQNPGFFETINIGPQSPKSENDFFILNAVRAAADITLHTSRTVRLETEMTANVQGPFESALKQWRKEMLHKGNARKVYLLTRADPPLDHPFFSPRDYEVHICYPKRFTDVNLRKSLQEKQFNHIFLHSFTCSSSHFGRDFIEYVYQVEKPGMGNPKTITVEMGPTSSLQLYDPKNPLVDFIFLSIFRSSSYSPSFLPFLSMDYLISHYDKLSETVSGQWTFILWKKMT